jgi:hypothetical protein
MFYLKNFKDCLNLIKICNLNFFLKFPPLPFGFYQSIDAINDNKSNTEIFMSFINFKSWFNLILIDATY